MKAAVQKDGPERSCVVTRTVKAPDDLIRFVAGPDGILVPDLRRKLPGRGVWASLSAATVAEAIKAKGPFKTVLGELSFTDKGDITRPDYVMYEWKKGDDGKYTYVQK